MGVTPAGWEGNRTWLSIIVSARPGRGIHGGAKATESCGGLVQLSGAFFQFVQQTDLIVVERAVENRQIV